MDASEFEKMSLEEQAKVIQKSPIRDKGDLLLHSQNPERLTKSLSQEELYLVLREMDLEERTEILRCATLRQLFFVSDIDCWNKDQIDTRGLVFWLEGLLGAGADRVLAWMTEIDYEMAVAALTKLVRVLKPEWEYVSDELTGDDPYFSLDGFYYILVKEENLNVVKRALEVLYERHRGRYVALMEGLVSEMPYELEEEAYRKREMRMADCGFPNRESAYQIYRPITTEEFNSYPMKTPAQESQDTGDQERVVPSYLISYGSSQLFLDDILQVCNAQDPEAAESVREELVWLANKIVACEGIDFVSEERVRVSVERSRSLTSLGLELLSERDQSRALKLLRERWLEIIFRVAYTKLRTLREQIETTIADHWKGERDNFVHFVGMPYDGILKGLLRQVPQVHDHRVAGSSEFFHEFASIRDYELAARAVTQIQMTFSFLSTRCKAFLQLHRLSGDEQDYTGKWIPMLGQIYLYYALHGRLPTKAVTPADEQTFFEKAFTETHAGMVLRREGRDEFIDALFGQAQLEALLPLWALVWQRLEEDLRYKCSIASKQKVPSKRSAKVNRRSTASAKRSKKSKIKARKG